MYCIVNTIVICILYIIRSILLVMSVQWSLFSPGAENCAVIYMLHDWSGLLKFDQCKRGR